MIVTSRELLKRSVCGEVKVERLAPDEVQSLLAARRPAILAPAHAAAWATIERETEGMALLVAAVAAILEDEEVDIDAYAASLGAMPLENLPAADEDGLPYPKRAAEILADFHSRLSPPLRRIAEYAFLMLPDRIERAWLEWLLDHDSGQSVAREHRLDLGVNKAGQPRTPAAIVEEAMRIGLLRESDAVYLQFHRLHRKQLARTFSVTRAAAHRDSVADLWSYGVGLAVQGDRAHQFKRSDRWWDALVLIGKGLRDAFAAARAEWPIELRSDLAEVYMNRGNSRESQGGYADADADYGEAITIMEGVQAALSARHAWTASHRDGLAAAYDARAVVRQALGDGEGRASDARRALEVAGSDDSGNPAAGG